MDYGKSLSYSLEDTSRLAKFSIGTLINMVPILNFAAVGYMVKITRNVTGGQPDTLPEWDDLGQKFVDGLVIAAATFIYSLPFLTLWCVGLAIWILPALAGKNEQASNALAGLSLAVMCVMGCLSLIYILALAFIFPAIAIFYAREGTFTACFKIGEMVRFISHNLSVYLGAVVLLFVGVLALTMVLGIVQIPLSIIPICGNVVGLVINMALAFYMQAIAAHLFGQIARQAVFT